ncbi:hypothetical protein Tco_1108196 [Tanacetum coccineum]
MLAPKCPTFNGRSTFANPRYLKKAQYEHPGLYAITQDQSDPATRLIPDREEILTLDAESRSKLNKDLVKPFDYTMLNSLYEIFRPPIVSFLEISVSYRQYVIKKEIVEKIIHELAELEFDKAEFSTCLICFCKNVMAKVCYVFLFASTYDLDEIKN